MLLFILEKNVSFHVTHVGGCMRGGGRGKITLDALLRTSPIRLPGVREQSKYLFSAGVKHRIHRRLIIPLELIEQRAPHPMGPTFTLGLMRKIFKY